MNKHSLADEILNGGNNAEESIAGQVDVPQTAEQKQEKDIAEETDKQEIVTEAKDKKNKKTASKTNNKKKKSKSGNSKAPKPTVSKGTCVKNIFLANKIAQGSVTDERIPFKIKFNDEGISEPIKNKLVLEKLLATGSELI